jgi:hypothetical protein
MRQISQRRMKRWLDRKCAEANKGRRYGLVPIAVDAPEVEGGREWMVGEAVPFAAPIFRWGAVLAPLKMVITRIGDDYPWLALRHNRLGREELSLRARLEVRAVGRARELALEREALEAEMRDFLLSRAKRRVSTVGGVRR